MSKNHLPVGRVSPSGVTRQAMNTPANEDVGLRCANPTYAAEHAELELEKTAVSQITRMELLGYPKITDEDERVIRAFLNECQILLLDEHIEAKAIQLRRSGVFKLPDAIVAASAMTHKLRLLTLDKGMLQGLQRQGYEF